MCAWTPNNSPKNAPKLKTSLKGSTFKYVGGSPDLQNVLEAMALMPKLKLYMVPCRRVDSPPQWYGPPPTLNPKP